MSMQRGEEVARNCPVVSMEDRVIEGERTMRTLESGGDSCPN